MTETETSQNPYSDQSLPSWKAIYLRTAERDALLALIPDPADCQGWQRLRALRDRAILSLFVFAGLRRNELRLLDRRDVDFRERSVHVRYGKRGKERRVPLHPTAAAALRAYLAERGDPDPALFLSQRSQRISNSGLSTVLHHYLPELDLDKRVTLHALRRTFATAVYRATKDGVTVQRLLGHARFDTTLLYIQLADDELTEAVDRI